MEIRMAEIKDIKKIAKLKVNTWKKTYKEIIDDEYIDNLNYKNIVKDLTKDIERDHIIVYEEGKKRQILGFCKYGDRIDTTAEGYVEYNSEIKAIYVDKDHIGDGIGKSMFNYIKLSLRQMGRQGIIMWCLEDNELARNFFESIGAKQLGEKKLRMNEVCYTKIGYGYQLNNFMFV